ncbi:hypothetical protein [Kitasatospora phosalacinea]|uniref:Uncharacterized protein n=1 Tax=Kitasatospora phosalacinea TaxID=2065 RepID=A0A9W6PF49_9ACTN|nr:hypothetical protein [Kitasatospora phosalacinea]GLW53961.1 hypothetical protein Kpho01_19720 [Kitasatospora phosalacinea]
MTAEASMPAWQGRKWQLLTQEASLSAQSIGIGLSYLRKANSDHPGLYYGGFFNYSIGLERLMKLTLLVDERIREGKFPESTDFKKAYGHDLAKLLLAIHRVRQDVDPVDLRWEYPAGPLAGIAIDNLADFAKFDRYHGLDTLTAAPKVKDIDPIARWYKEVGGPILQGRPVRYLEVDSARVEFLNVAIGSAAIMRGVGEDGSVVETIGGAYLKSRDSEYIAKHGTFLCAAIARYVADVLLALFWKGCAAGVDELPVFSEFFAQLMNSDSTLKGRKSFYIR